MKSLPAALVTTFALVGLLATSPALAAGGAGGGGGGGATTGGADLQITGSSGGNPNPGGTVGYDFLVKNNGPSDAQSVTFTDQIPSGTSPGISHVTPPGQGVQTCGTATDASAATTVTCNVGTLAKGAQAVIQVVVAAPIVTSTFSNTGAVTSSTADPKPANNAVTLTKSVTAVTCALPPGETTLNGAVMFTNNEPLNQVPVSFDFTSAGVDYTVLNNFSDFGSPFTQVINLACKTVPAQFIRAGVFVNVTGTIDPIVETPFGPHGVIHAEVVQVPTFLDALA